MKAERATAVEAAYDAHAARLLAVLTALTGDRGEAEDLLQETFVRALTAWGHGVPDAPEAWLRTVAVNLARTRWRRAGMLRALTPRIATPDSTPDLSPDHAALLAALRRLPAAQREAVVLHHLLDLSVDDVAALLRAPTGTVKARLARGRAALAPLLADDDSTATGKPATIGGPRA